MIEETDAIGAGYVALTRSTVLGDAFTTLHVRRSPRGRRRIMVRSQVPFAVLVSVVLAAVIVAGASHVDVIVGSWVLVLLVTAGSLTLPWERRPETIGLVIAGLDLVAVAALAGVLGHAYSSIGLLEVLPVVVVAFSFGLAGTVEAVVGSFVVAFIPVLTGAQHPVGDMGWVNLLLVPVTVSLLAAALRFLSLVLQRSEARLRKAAEAAEKSEAIITTVLNTIDVGTAYVTPDNETAFTNKAFEAIAARSVVDPVTLAGTRVYDNDRQTPVPADQQMMAQAARGEYFDSRLYWIGEPGDQRAILVSARQVIGPDGASIGTAFVSKDVTELTDAIRAREDFLAGVSHELRTPLTSIIGYLEVIDDSVDVEAAGIGRELGIIQRNANQLMMRIGDLLHMTDESVELRVREVDIPRIVEQAVDGIRFRAENTGLTIVAELCDPFTASVDPSRFAQVLDNLLTNAVKYTPRDGSITVELTTDAATFTLVIADTGSGIGVAELPRVFERFYRAEAVRGSAIAGVGLGLSIVRSIVVAHGGTVEVASELGHGTSFTVTMPRYA